MERTHVRCYAVNFRLSREDERRAKIILGWTIGGARASRLRVAEEVMLDSSYDRIVQLTQLRLKEAQAFLLMLADVRGEIKPDAALPASAPVGTPEMYHTAAYAVVRRLSEKR